VRDAREVSCEGNLLRIPWRDLSICLLVASVLIELDDATNDFTCDHVGIGFIDLV